MARQRTINPNIWTSEQFISIKSPWARLLFIGIISNADDEGRMVATLGHLKATVFPGDDHKRIKVGQWRNELAEKGLIIIYSGTGEGQVGANQGISRGQLGTDGGHLGTKDDKKIPMCTLPNPHLNKTEYLYLPNWHKYQHISRPYPSLIPPPPFNESSVNNHGIVNEQSALIGNGIGNGNEVGIGNGGKVPPPAAAPLSEKEKAFFAVYENNFGTVPSIHVSELKLAANIYPLDWVKDAFVEMDKAKPNKRCWEYVAKILERWSTEGRKAEKPEGEPADSQQEYYRRYGHLLKKGAKP